MSDLNRIDVIKPPSDKKWIPLDTEELDKAFGITPEMRQKLDNPNSIESIIVKISINAFYNRSSCLPGIVEVGKL